MISSSPSTTKNSSSTSPCAWVGGPPPGGTSALMSVIAPPLFLASSSIWYSSPLIHTFSPAPASREEYRKSLAADIESCVSVLGTLNTFLVESLERERHFP